MLVLTVTDVNQALLLCKQRNAARLLVLFHLFQSLLAGLNKEKMRRCAKRAEEGGGGGVMGRYLFSTKSDRFDTKNMSHHTCFCFDLYCHSATST